MNGKGDCIVKALLHIKKELPAMKWKQLLGKLEQAIVHSGILLFAIGLLLGRAVILTEMSPFALPFFAAVLLLKYEHVRLVFVAIMLGASLHSIETTMYIFLSLIICLVLYQFVKKRVADVMKKVPLIVFVSSLSARFIYMFITEQLFMTKMMVAFVEAGLSLLLAVIFLQSMPLVTFNPLKRRNHLFYHFAGFDTDGNDRMVGIRYIVRKYVCTLFHLAVCIYRGSGDRSDGRCSHRVNFKLG